MRKSGNWLLCAGVFAFAFVAIAIGNMFMPSQRDANVVHGAVATGITISTNGTTVSFVRPGITWISEHLPYMVSEFAIGDIDVEISQDRAMIPSFYSGRDEGDLLVASDIMNDWLFNPHMWRYEMEFYFRLTWGLQVTGFIPMLVLRDAPLASVLSDTPFVSVGIRAYPAPAGEFLRFTSHSFSDEDTVAQTVLNFTVAHNVLYVVLNAEVSYGMEASIPLNNNRIAVGRGLNTIRIDVSYDEDVVREYILRVTVPNPPPPDGGGANGENGGDEMPPRHVPPVNIMISGSILSWTGEASLGFGIIIGTSRVASVWYRVTEFDLTNLNLPFGRHEVRVIVLGNGWDYLDSLPSAPLTFTVHRDWGGFPDWGWIFIASILGVLAFFLLVAFVLKRRVAYIARQPMNMAETACNLAVADAAKTCKKSEKASLKSMKKPDSKILKGKAAHCSARADRAIDKATECVAKYNEMQEEVKEKAQKREAAKQAAKPKVQNNVATKPKTDTVKPKGKNSK